MGMKLRITAAAAAAVLGLASGLAAGPASAQLRVGGGGVDVVAPANTTAVQGSVDPANTIVRDSRRTGGHTLRCWQHGRLLYEGAGFRGTLSSPNAVSIPRRSGEGDAVTVINLNDAFCMLAD
jgi:hypothetical protein